MTEDEYWAQRAENDRRQIDLAEVQAERAYAQEEYRARQRQLLPWKIVAGFLAVPLIILFVAGFFAIVAG
ncbi:hypothetical protein VR010_14955 [Actinomycetaceae bacterium L2_0104]